MAGRTLEQVKTVIDDLKVSWYFRIWAALWVVCAVMVFVSLVILGARSHQAEKQQALRIWKETPRYINFPKFHFRVSNLPGNQNVFSPSQCSCSFNFQPVPSQSCTMNNGSNLPQTTCLAFDATKLQVSTNWNDDNFNNLGINCVLYAANTGDQNLMVGFNVEGDHVQATGGNSFASVWFIPNNQTWILLEKSITESDDEGDTIGWNRDLVYHSSIWTSFDNGTSSYNVTVFIGSFTVTHLTAADAYDGWMSTGTIGGFAFFVLILHTIMMLIVGVFFDSHDVKFLRGPGGGSSEERTPILGR